ncbi:hypothetical protein OF83DRAFT_1051221 [Amylostereum chailletii]|nr:hypothetical protein OF83DRAFT_1051221 [Amylostereum chailletii]
MASPSSPYGPSSSAVTIPTPGRSILKRPAPTQQSFFSRFSKFLPTQNNQPQTNGDEGKTLKRAHFILPELVTVYPISAVNPPSMPSLKDEKRSIEQREFERRRRVVRGNSINGSSETEEWWSMERVEAFYKECCASREEPPSPEISTALKNASGSAPRTVDFSGVQLTPSLAATLSDVLTIEWGLRRLTFRECGLDDRILKPILHSLLIPGSLTFLSVASNRRLKAPAFRLIGAYVSKAKTLQFLDLSQNPLDKKSVEYIAAALAQCPDQGLTSLKLDDCSLKPLGLEALAHLVRTSSLRNISLRHNRINATGAVAIALMIRDYPDVVPGSAPGSAPSTPPMSPSRTAPPSLPAAYIPAPAPAPLPPRSGPLPPPPKHPNTAHQTTYTPYIPRSKRAAATAAQTSVNPLSPNGQQIPIITSSAQGGITTRHPVPPAPSQGSQSSTGYHDHGPSAALLDKVRALDALPRLGALKTLDLRGNDLRTGISYIAQVLKRNRTLKVLNLSENKLSVQELVSIADALKYNSCLETLDLSKNPCSGPGLEGIQSLRTAFTLNTSLKRLFLASTSMTSAGAIALAEFLPESSSLLHLDLTMNNLELAGVMAINSGLKGNHIMRCLDLNIPPDDEGLAQMCRDILNTCIRNTEEAERSTQSVANGSSGRGQGKGVWNMIEESELHRTIRKDDAKKVDESTSSASPPMPLLTLEAQQQTESDVVVRARAVQTELEALLARSPSSSSAPSSPVGGADPELVSKTKAVIKPLNDMIRSTSDPTKLEDLLVLNDSLTSLLAQVNPRPQLSLQGLGLAFRQLTPSPTPSPANGSANGMTNGHVVVSPNPQDDDQGEDLPVTPRIDKGKGKAPPEPEVHEQVMSPDIMSPRIFQLPSSDEEGENDILADQRSPVVRSRNWVAEEGEVFRRGNKLLGPEEMEGEFDGEELRIELLEAEVARPPPRLVDEFGMPLDHLSVVDSKPKEELEPEEPSKSLPRAYVPRRSSTASLNARSPDVSTPPSMSLASPLTEDVVVDSPTGSQSPAVSSPLPRPYMPRRKSSNSSLDPR